MQCAGSPKASPRNSPFTSPRGSNQWSSRASVGELAISRRGSRFDGVEIRETPYEEEAEAREERTAGAATLAAPAGGAASSPAAGAGTKRQQLLTIPNKGVEVSSSAETLSGKSLLWLPLLSSIVLHSAMTFDCHAIAAFRISLT